MKRTCMILECGSQKPQKVKVESTNHHALAHEHSSNLFFFTCAFSLALCEQNVLHNYYTVSNFFHTFMTVRDVDMLQPITFLTHQKAFNTLQKINNHYEY